MYDDKDTVLGTDIEKHEGDWEMIQIICDEEENPETVGYSQHYGGDKKDWIDLEFFEETNHPIVYVAKGTHASYLHSGTEDWEIPLLNIGATEYHEGDVVKVTNEDYEIIPIHLNPWLNFQGNWGEDGGSVGGPVWRHSQRFIGIISTGHWFKPKANIWIDSIYWNSLLGSG